MHEEKSGSQTIGCKVASCRYNHQSSKCELSRIDVEPRKSCHSGESEESLCGSYRTK